MATSFTQALHDKYIEQEIINDKFDIPSDNAISTQITFVGFGKVCSVQKQLCKLISLDLTGLHIETAGSLNSIADHLVNVRILNLSQNRIKSWDDVINIVGKLPNLCELIVNENPLMPLENTNRFSGFNTLDSLVLGRTGLDWLTAVEIASSSWSRIKQFDLWDNQLVNCSFIFSLTGRQIDFITLIEVLKLRENKIESFEFLAFIETNFESLVEIDLSKNKLCEITICDRVALQLRNLKFLNISGNNIVLWKSIAQLNKLPKLENLLCFDNPFFITERFALAYTVARLGKLTHLNREEITNLLRNDSEILYVRRHYPQYRMFIEGQYPDFFAFHPRYEELLKIVGEPEDSKAKARVNKYVKVFLCYKDKKLEKKLANDLLVSKVKMLCRSLFRLPSSIRFVLKATPNNCGEEHSYDLDIETRLLNFYSIQDNYVIRVVEDTS